MKTFTSKLKNQVIHYVCLWRHLCINMLDIHRVIGVTHCFTSLSLWWGLYCRPVDKPVCKHKHWRSGCPTYTIVLRKSHHCSSSPPSSRPYSKSCTSGDKAAHALPSHLDDISTVFLSRPNASCLSGACRSGKTLKLQSCWITLSCTLKSSHGWAVDLCDKFMRPK